MHTLSELDIFVHASSILISLFFDDNYYCSVASRARYITLVNVRFIGKLACPVNYNIIHQVGSVDLANATISRHASFTSQ